MKRRALLAAASASLASLSGCAAIGSVARAGVSDSRFAGRTVPDLPTEAGTFWYHEVGSAPHTMLEPSTERMALPRGEATFTFHNLSAGRIGINPYDWALWKLHEGVWKKIAPYAVLLPLKYVPPGGSSRHTFGFDNVDPDKFGGLGPGLYAYEHGHLPANGSGDPPAVTAALFELVGDPIALTPTDAIARTERDGDAIVVYTKSWTDAERRATLTLRRIEFDPEAEVLITEQVMQRENLRNALSQLVRSDASEVRLKGATRTGRGDVDYRIPDGGVRFTFDGETYRANAAREESDASS